MGLFNSKVSIDAPANGKMPIVSSEVSSRYSHKNSLKLDNSDPDVSLKTLTFRHVMKDPLGREFFMKFLKTEHAEENMLFYEEVEKLKLLTDEGEMLPFIAQLVADYLIPGVETEVNISDQMKTQLIKMSKDSQLKEKLKEFLKSLEKAQHEISMMLAMGPFPRFIKSPAFKQYKIKAREIRDAEDADDARMAEAV